MKVTMLVTSFNMYSVGQSANQKMKVSTEDKATMTVIKLNSLISKHATLSPLQTCMV